MCCLTLPDQVQDAHCCDVGGGGSHSALIAEVMGLWAACAGAPQGVADAEAQAGGERDGGACLCRTAKGGRPQAPEEEQQAGETASKTASR